MDNPAQELALKNAIQDHNQTLVDIATGKVTSSEITEITSAQYTNQIKLFLLAQARKELMRVVKLTEFLTKVEDMYEERVMENLDKLSLDSFPDIISTITSCLKRSDDIMQSVLKNDSLKSLTLINYNSNNDRFFLCAHNVYSLLNFDGYGSVCLVAPHTDISACAIYFYCTIVLTALREKNDWIICP